MKRFLPFLPAAGAGLLLGCLLPLMKSQPAAASGTAHEPAATRQPALAFEMPANDRTAWAAGFGANHPQEFYRWLLKQDPQPDPEMVRAFFHAWIQTDPDAAFTAALRLPARFGFAPATEKSPFDPVADGGFFIMEVKGLLESNPAAAFRWIGRVEGVLGAFGVMNFVTPFENHPELKREDVAKWLNQSLPGPFTGTMINSYGSFLLENRGLKDCLAWMHTLNPEHQGAVLDSLCLEWGKADPDGMLDYLESATSPIRQYRATALLSPLRAESPLKAMEWLDQNLGVTSYTGLNNVLGAFDSKDPEAAQEYVMNLEDPAQRLDAIKGLGEAHTMRGPVPETMQWVATLPAEMQVEATAGAMRWRLGSDYISFLTPLSEGTLAPEIQDRYIQQLAGGIDQGMMWDGKDAIHQWLENNPGEVRDAFVKAALGVLEGKPLNRSKFLSYLPEAEAEAKRILGK
ncbi:MAG: hypothetical protein JWO82_1167 [Akkermansiaceae bacterium]|nr:hypothetical protein [Akkermansiaceae bacterium]